MAALLIAVCGVAGICGGCVAHAVAVRAMRNEPIRRSDLMPLQRWRAGWRDRQTLRDRIGVEATIVMLGTGVSFALLSWRIGAAAELGAFLVCSAGLICFSLIDLRTRRLPTTVLHPTTVATVMLLVLAAAIERDWWSLRDALVSGCVAFATFLAIHVVYPRGLGFSDVRLSFLLGLVLGWESPGHAMVGLLLGFTLAAVIGTAIAIATRSGRSTEIPFVPFLSAGWLTALLAGDQLIDWWLTT